MINHSTKDKLIKASMVTRRGFLRGIAGAGGWMLLGSLACSRPQVRLAGVAPSQWVAPPEAQFTTSARSAPMALSREIRTTLRVGFSQLKIGEDAVNLRSYNGAITGPVLRVKPGDRLMVDLINGLPDDGSAHPSNVNTPHGFNITNLHAHGLNVSPLMGDNVFLEIGPNAKDGTSKTLIYEIPEDHPAGTCWYHPHKHGSVAVQVASGMAGALVVEGDIDEVPEIAAAQERIFIFQQIPYNKQKGGTVEFDDVLAPFSTPENPRFTTINGQLKPIINMQPGEVQRWRFIHAGIKEKLTIALDQHQLSVIAHDGITTGRRDDKLVVELFPGYRADVLVKADKRPGTYKLHDSADVNGLFDAETEQELADVVIAGEVKDMRLPEPGQLKPLAPLEDLRDVALTREPIRIKFKNAAGQFTVCGKLFKPDDPPIEMKLNSVDEWILTTEAIGTRPRQHPFHIHVNPFQIMSVGGVNQEYLWRDTVIVKENEPVVMRTRYRNFPGQSVLHCHILDHEDRGMMLKINIVEGEPTPFPCP